LIREVMQQEGAEPVIELDELDADPYADADL
jgi:hypothetical protein